MLIINLFYENKKLTKCSKLRPCKVEMGISPDTVKFSMEGPQNKIRLYHIIQLYHSWVYTQRPSQHTTERPACPYSLQWCSQHSCYKISLDVINEWANKENVADTHRGALLSHKGEWNYALDRKLTEQEIILLCPVSPSQSVAHFLSCVERGGETWKFRGH